MSLYTIREVIGTPNAWSSQKGGPMLSYSLDVTGDDGFTGQVELNQKDSTPAPTVGQVIDGTLDRSNPKYAPKLKKTPPQGGGFGGGGPRSGGGGKSKADQDSIERAVAFKGAVDIVASVAIPGDDLAPLKNALTEMFEYSLALLQGSATPTVNAAIADTRAEVKDIIKDAFPDAEEVAPANGELTDAYDEWSKRSASTGTTPEERTKTLETKKTALGIAGPVKDATPSQKRELLDWFREN